MAADDDRDQIEDVFEVTRFAESRCDPGDHDWPAELDSDARCERCGLRYGEFSVEDG